tara:strand:- start:374 stop:1114 length:741 start_codon:yes stop_codon:yes gene_type:complete
MLSIFSPKTFLRDLLVGFTDVHNHILPGIDDGAKTVEESIDLINGLNNLGFKEFIATPHTMNDYYPNTYETITNAHNTVQQALTKKLSNIKIGYSSEYMMDSHFENLLEENKITPLKDSLILVEMSYLQPPINLEEIIYKIGVAGYEPILAHPERYAFYHKNYEYYKTLKKLGCKFQLNMLSLTSQYGESVTKTANRLLKDGMIDYIASDTHHKRHVSKIGSLKLNKNQVTYLKPIITETNLIFSS